MLYLPTSLAVPGKPDAASFVNIKSCLNEGLFSVQSDKDAFRRDKLSCRKRPETEGGLVFIMFKNIIHDDLKQACKNRSESNSNKAQEQHDKEEDQYQDCEGYVDHGNDEYYFDPNLDLAVFFLSLDGINNKKDYRPKEENNKKKDEHISEQLR